MELPSAKWRARFLEAATLVSTWSKDPSTKVGCVLVDSRKRIIGTGYNGFPRGVHDARDRLNNREVKYQVVQHAEVNAVLNAVVSPEGCLAVATHPVCASCAGVLIQAGVSGVMYYNPGRDPERAKLAERFGKSFGLAEEMFEEANVSLWRVRDNGTIFNPIFDIT